MGEGRSRGSSQEPRPGKSPTPARATPQPPSEPPLAPVDPKVAKLDKINEEVESLMEKIRNFSGSKQDKEYLYLDEILTRHLIALDGIEPEGQSEIRQMRKESIKSVIAGWTSIGGRTGQIKVEACQLLPMKPRNR